MSGFKNTVALRSRLTKTQRLKRAEKREARATNRELQAIEDAKPKVFEKGGGPVR